jgi:hypothetical protein
MYLYLLRKCTTKITVFEGFFSIENQHKKNETSWDHKMTDLARNLEVWFSPFLAAQHSGVLLEIPNHLKSEGDCFLNLNTGLFL